MTILSAQDLVLPAAAFGAENPLPPIQRKAGRGRLDNHADLPAEMRQNLEYGQLGYSLPCLTQDNYDRSLVDRPIPTLVLENDHLRATVLPSLGGRLYSLVHQASGQELLYRNPVLQPANLALRDAWFAGGVEWNLGSTGHWTGTCSPMHAARVEGPDGSPILRLWEWERSRNLVTQLDFWLPDDSEFLYVGARIQNPSTDPAPVYWWSNIAVEQAPDTRVLVPANQAWQHGYGNRLDLVDLPVQDEVDLSYPMRHRRAIDFFFEPLPEQQPWIAALDADGNGLVQTSTERLPGRKMFVWGESRGGHRWQEWLSPGKQNDGYCEIQAGLAKTQLEHLKLPEATEWHWLEAYGRLDVDPAVAHAEEWEVARTGVAATLKSLLSATDLAGREKDWLTVADSAPGETLSAGSGWGALELRRTGWKVSTGTPFGDATMSDRERAWLPVLEGRMPASAAAPDGTLVGWRELLEAVEDDNWLSWYHRGVARWYAGDEPGAIEAWHRSRTSQDNPWALRNLAIATGDESYYERAVELSSPQRAELLAEAMNAFLASGGTAQAQRVFEQAGHLASDPRIRHAKVRLLLQSGDPEGAESLLDEGIELPGLREGENDLAGLWREIQEQLGKDRTVPTQYEFSMLGDRGETGS
ncbi:DUF5107 domain-containing protein [Kribbella qitaiheensis]|uniref:DUF5107 domain-containing protein n=1 Tax=Kribbella qitaiheensis TaxID=1544730 RepID=A0A7G6X2P7_9ACTN|nr:DUF5107 domain-containing protein [Kribbella qitaiheensis]QNE20512.1 DUF5107 domain-containing protein [Kribbella qitaiheensis]